MPPSDKEAKLLAEIDGWGRHKALPSAADLPSALPYTAAVVQEALRMYPPAAVAVREVPCGISLGDKAIPGDAALQVLDGWIGMGWGGCVVWRVDGALPF